MCIQDRTCATARVCSTGTEYETQALTPTSDRVCAKVSVCGPGERVGVAAGPTTDLTCTPCDANTFMEARSHRAMTCSQQVTCDTGEFVTKLKTTTKAVCQACRAGTFQDARNHREGSCKAHRECSQGQLIIATSATFEGTCVECPTGQSTRHVYASMHACACACALPGHSQRLFV